MKMYSLYEIETVEQAVALKDGTAVCLHNVSPGSWETCNPHFSAIMRVLESRSVHGWQHVQLDGVCRYDLLVATPETTAQIEDTLARSAGYDSAAAMEAEILASDR